MQQLIQKNLKWVILVVTFLLLTNTLSLVHVDRFSKKEQKKLKRSYDSLHLLFIQANLALKEEVINRRKIFLVDSFNTLQLKQQRKKDSLLIIKQKKQLDKFKHLPASVNLFKLDSAYVAEN